MAPGGVMQASQAKIQSVVLHSCNAYEPQQRSEQQEIPKGAMVAVMS